MFKRIAQIAALAVLAGAAFSAQANGTLISSTAQNTFNNILSLGSAVTNFGFTDETGSYLSGASGDGDFYSDFLFTFNPISNVQAATITLDNGGGVSNLSERLYAYSGSFLNNAAAGATLVQSWSSDYPTLNVTVANLVAQPLAAGTYVLEVRGTNAGNFSGSVSFAPAVPEPSTLSLLLAGLSAITCMAVRRKRG